MESKYLLFTKQVNSGRKTPIYIIKNKTTLDSLGIIYFYPAWRRYVLETNAGIIFDTSCLADITQFMQEIQAEWKANIKSRKEEKYEN